MAKCAAESALRRSPPSCARQTSSSGGSSDTEVKLLTVNPAGVPSSVRQVTTVTPVAKQPSASRKRARVMPGAIFAGGRRLGHDLAIQAASARSIAG